MFKNEYQGGTVVEIFSAQGKDPVAKWKLCGAQPGIKKEFDKEVKGFVYCLEGNGQTIRMQMPKDGKTPLGLVQRFLVLQVNVPQIKDFSTELLVTDLGHLKRRLYLSTVHKEFSATPLHARIPFMGLKRDTWCNVCIDLASFTGELFKGSGYLTLDGITVCASCKLRRVFTMKTEPAGALDGDVFICRDGPRAAVPRSCQLPPDVQHVTQVFHMDRLRLADGKTGPSSSEGDQWGTARSENGGRGGGETHIAFGSRVLGPPPPTGKKNSGPPEGAEGRPHRTPNNMTQVSSGRTSQPSAVERLSLGDGSERPPAGDKPASTPRKKDPVLSERPGRHGSLQPQPPKDTGPERQSGRTQRLHGAGLRRAKSSDAAASRSGRGVGQGTESAPAPPSSRGESSRRPLTPPEMSAGQRADEVLSSRSREGAPGGDPPRSLEAVPGRSSPERCPSVLGPWASQEDSDQDPEPQLSMEEEVFTFSSKPHSARRGPGDMESPGPHDELKEPAGRKGAQPEDDFLGSESDEEEAYSRFHHLRSASGSGPMSPRYSGPSGEAQLGASPGSSIAHQATHREPTPTTPTLLAYPPTGMRAEPPGMLPVRCLSPDGPRPTHRCGPGRASHALGQGSATSLSRKSLREVPRRDSRIHKVEDGGSEPEPVGSRGGLGLARGLRAHEEEEEEVEQRMLASLRREQQEEEEEVEEGSGLSHSRVGQCDISISTSSDDTSTWTHVATPANQGHHYQKEMNPLLHSNPREWMDVLSPPIIPPGRWESGDSWDPRKEHPVRGAGASVNKVENEEEYLNLLYDPCLNCYFDPTTGKYYELA